MVDKKRRQGGPRNIQSQNPSEITPYYPTYQADVLATAKYREPIEHGYAPGGAFTVAGYDSRLPNSIEFLKSTLWGGNVNTPRPPGITFTDPNPGFAGRGMIIEYTVPLGRTLILRKWGLDVYFNGAAQFTNNNFIITQVGLPIINFRVDFLINGSVVPEYSSIYVPDLCFGPVEVDDAFIIVPEGQKLGLQVEIVASFNGALDGTITLSGGRCDMGGQLLLSTGDSPNFEPTNQEPIPVEFKETLVDE